MPGLTTAAVRERRARYGPNALPETPAPSLARRFVRQFKSPLIYVLLFALLVDLVRWLARGGGGVPVESGTIAAILVLNAGLGVWQERKAAGVLAALQRLAAPQIWAWRDGALTRVATADLVPGDVIRLEAGDRVPADAVLHPSLPGPVMVDESVLTGESTPVDRSGGDEVSAGTMRVAGQASAEVTRTGPASALGQIAAMLGRVVAERTPLEQRLDAFGGRVARWVLAVAALLVVGGIWVEGAGRAGSVVLLAVALAVAAVPEGLPAVVTLTLMLGVQRMARRQAVVRKLAAVEALGSVTVIATDKTGTLTENRLEVHDVDSPDLSRATRAMVLANDAEATSQAGDPLDLALLRHAAPAVDPETLRADHPRRSHRPFDPGTRFMRVSVTEDGRIVSYCKGAPEVLLARCNLTDDERRVWREKTGAYAAEGFRLLALAWGDGETEDALRWLGVVLLWDPPRPEVLEAVRRGRDAGIRILIITGDHPGTAVTVARVVGLEHHTVITGAEWSALSPEGRLRAVRETHVFARVNPEEKLGIVEALQADGEIVAVTGDGVNDAPALKRANVGVAMGQRGSDVSREVADIVLLDDNFATIVAAVEEGRGIFENIQKSIRFLFSTNLSELLLVTVGALAAAVLELRGTGGGLLLPLTAAQLLWINLVTDGAPALALGLDRNPDVMRRPPRDPAAPLLDRRSLRFIVLSGAVKAGVAFTILGLLPGVFGQSLAVTATATFLFISAGQVLFAYPSRHTDARPRANRVLLTAVVVSLAVQPLLVAVPAFRSAFGTVALPPFVWAVVAAAIVVSWGLAEAVNRVVWPHASMKPG